MLDDVQVSNEELGTLGGDSDVLGTILLEMNQSPVNRLNVTVSGPEDFLTGHGVKWSAALGTMGWAFIVIGILIFFGIVISFVGTFIFAGEFRLPRGAIGYWVPWFCLALFMVTACFEMFYITGIVTGLMASFPRIATTLTNGTLSELTISLAAVSSTGLPWTALVHQAAMTQDLVLPSSPSLCMAAWVPFNMTANAYPSGSAVHAFNIRRIADVTTRDMPEMDYVKELILEDPYPPTSGGITTEQARPFRALSNACEAFHGDIEQCCADSNAGNWKTQCPGRELSSHAANHCTCLAGLAQLGLAVESTAISLCITTLRDLVELAVVDITAPMRASWPFPVLSS